MKATLLSWWLALQLLALVGWRPCHGLSVPPASSQQVLALNYRCTVKPDHRDAWLAQIQEDRKCTRRDEPGNLQFVLGQDTNDENTFHLHEEFKSLPAFMDHCASPHFARYDQFLKETDPFVGEPSICFYHPFGEPEGPPEKRPIHKGAFGVHVNLYPKAEMEEAFSTVIANNKEGTDTQEPLALQYTYGASVGVEGIAKTQPQTYHFHEQYAGADHGKEGFDAHAATSHFASWETFVGTDPFSKAPEVFFFKILED